MVEEQDDAEIPDKMVFGAKSAIVVSAYGVGNARFERRVVGARAIAGQCEEAIGMLRFLKVLRRWMWTRSFPVQPPQDHSLYCDKDQWSCR